MMEEPQKKMIYMYYQMSLDLNTVEPGKRLESIKLLGGTYKAIKVRRFENEQDSDLVFASSTTHF